MCCENIKRLFLVSFSVDSICNCSILVALFNH